MKSSTIATDKTTVLDLSEPYAELDAAHGLRSFYLGADFESSALFTHICERVEALNPDILSFDVFDTALLRQAKSEAHRFMDISGLFVERLQANDADTEIDSVDGLVARALAARASYSLARAYHGNREGRLAEIARIACDLLGQPDQSDAYIEEEMAYEARSLTANPLVALLRRKFPDKRIVFISDMYLEGDRIRELLNHHLEDVGDAGLFASTDGLGSKRSGGLFRSVVDRLDAEPERILHFGDNFGSDYRKAKAAGWQAIYLPLPQAELDHRKQCFQQVCETAAGRGIDLKRYLAFNP
jgi:predicted HAD superfamily hydrolase